VEYLAAVWPVSREQILHSPLEVTMDRRGTLVGLAFVYATVGAVGITKMAAAEDGKRFLKSPIGYRFPCRWLLPKK